ncbi:YbdD/YjiX family protein [Plantibacter sp. VKM Ac-2880]|uniref:YbdD/YjiX family protein n=1 Tax=Plantibacter sp. VKM Ac-2880 TaxID=2783827 RepID=UPI0018900610|nr:YbdD/YjiX family protein [Plantibacter sp. VKM Ac-2880]MBF4567693.1 YbdD/YjiX family protein [Plantibacter sp. VKM Ac-2880]
MSGTGSAAGPGTVGLAVRRGWASVRWFVTSLMGDTAYATYVEHHRRVHPDTPVPDERTFWRERFAEQDRTPGSRCC